MSGQLPVAGADAPGEGVSPAVVVGGASVGLGFGMDGLVEGAVGPASDVNGVLFGAALPQPSTINASGTTSTCMHTRTLVKGMRVPSMVRDAELGTGLSGRISAAAMEYPPPAVVNPARYATAPPQSFA